MTDPSARVAARLGQAQGTRLAARLDQAQNTERGSGRQQFDRFSVDSANSLCLSGDPSEELQLRALRTRLVLTDCDGVLTDGGAYYSGIGEEFKRFSVRDGMGVERLRQSRIETAIITREQSPSIKKRAEKLKLRYLYLGVRDKYAHIGVVTDQTGFGLDQLAYIGDDVNDLELIQAIDEKGLTGAPMDAMPEVRGAVHYCCVACGGYGAFRDFAEWILGLRDRA